MKNLETERTKKTLKVFSFLLLTMPVFLLPALSLAEALVIVNPKLNITELSREDLQKILLGKKLTWDDENETEVKFVLLPNADCHDALIKASTKKTAAQFTRYWRNLLFTGKGQLPKNMQSAGEMLQFVRETQGAIGYVCPGSPIDGVTVIDIKD